MGERNTLLGFIMRFLLVVIFVLLLVWLLPIPKLNTFYDSVFSKNINEMKDAAMSYYTNERLPKEDGESVKMTLQEMIDEHLLLPFVDERGKSCDADHSYVEVTKDGKEYVMKVYLSCDNQKDFIKVPMGCYDKCENNACGEGTKVCPVSYQYKKTETATKKVAYCDKGYKLKNNKCVKETTTTKTETIEATKTVGESKSTCSNGSKPVNGICTIKLPTTRTLIPATTEKYTEEECEKVKCNCRTQYINYRPVTTCSTCESCETVTKERTIPEKIKYSCPAETTKSTGSGSSLICYKEEKATVTPGATTYSCPVDYKQNGTNCEKKVTEVKTETKKVKYKTKKYTTTKYKWSTETTLSGWTKTGKTKQTSCK